MTLDGQITSQQKNDEGAEAGKQIAADLDALAIEVPGDPDFFQFAGQDIEFAAFDVMGAIAVNFVDARDGFGNFAGKFTGQIDPLFVFPVGASLQLRKDEKGRCPTAPR